MRQLQIWESNSEGNSINTLDAVTQEANTYEKRVLKGPKCSYQPGYKGLSAGQAAE